MKAGLYLQDLSSYTDKNFYSVMKKVKDAKLDLLVFPEHAMSPWEKKLNKLSILNDNDSSDIQEIEDIISKISELAGCAILFCHLDSNDAIYSYFFNPKPKQNETQSKFYLKHVATNCSSFDLSNFKDFISDSFEPIDYKGLKIGQTICYDSNFPVFSRVYGKNQVDLIINSTGGPVNFKKWNYYQKVRAIENQCYVLCTMSFFDNNSSNNVSSVFGLDNYGKNLDYTIVNNNYDDDSTLIPDAVYVFNIEKKKITHDYSNLDNYEVDEYIDQEESINNNVHYKIKLSDFYNNLNPKTLKAKNLYVIPFEDKNIVVAKIIGDNILKPEAVLSLLYHPKLSEIKDKRYIILNHWEDLELDYYEKVISNVLKVRAAENFCTVIMKSDEISKCFQVGFNKNIQVIAENKKSFGLDLTRMTGPESLWKNKGGLGMKKAWREGYEQLIDIISK